MKNSVTKRDPVLDLAKGLTIAMVVFAHAVLVANSFNWTVAIKTWYFEAPSDFMMELFFFISGYLAYNRLNKRGLQRRFFTLIIPFISWSILLYYWSAFSFSGITGIYPLKSGVIKNLLYCAWTLNTSSIWFLPALFGVFVLFFLTRGKLWGIILTIVLAYGLSQISFLQEPLGLPRTAWFSRIAWLMTFMAGGYYVAKYREKLHSLKFIPWFALVAFPIFFLWGRQMDVGISRLSWPDYNIGGKEILLGLYRFWLACLGAGMIFALGNLFSRIVGVRRVIAYLGVISLGIYCAHGMWRNISFGDGIVKVLSITVIATILATATTWILRRFWATDFVFFGNTRKFNLRSISFRRQGLPVAGPVKDQSTGETA